MRRAPPVSCLFCGILDGSVAASVAYEDAATVANLDLR